MAGDEDGSLGFVNQPGRLFQAGDSLVAKGLAGRLGNLRIFELSQFKLNVPGDVNQYRAGPSLLGDLEGLADGAGQVGRGHYQVSALGTNRRDGTDVTFLEGLGAQGGAGHLSGDGDHGHGIGLGAHEAGNQVGGAGARGGDANANLAGDAGIAVGGVGRGLLVAHEHMTKLGVAPESVVKGKNGPARMPEDYVNSFLEQTLADDLRSFKLHSGLQYYCLLPPRKVSGKPPEGKQKIPSHIGTG